jgi:hypothetical protein
MDTLAELRTHLAVLRIRMRRASDDGQLEGTDDDPADADSGWEPEDTRARVKRRLPHSVTLSALQKVRSPAERAPNPSLPQQRDVDPMVVLLLEIHGRPVGKWRLTARELGFPLSAVRLTALRDRLGSSSGTTTQGPQTVANLVPAASQEAHVRRQLYSLQLPGRVANGIGEALARHAPRAPALWVQIGEPAAYLPLVGWETLLRRTTTLPILRLPYHQLDAETGATSPTERPLDIALCCTAPYAQIPLSAATIRSLVRRMLDAVPSTRRCTVHLFADAALRDALANDERSRPLWSKNPNARGAVLYELPEVPSMHGATPSSGAVVRAALSEDNPWGNWMRERLQGRAVDVCHLVAPGSLFAHDAAAVVAWAPSLTGAPSTTNVPVRFVNALDLQGLAARVGAWATVLSPYGTDVSRIALRVVADQLARSRPGPVAVHDVVRDRRGHGLAALYQFLQASSPAAVPSHRTLSLYTHPTRIGITAPETQSIPVLAEAFRNIAVATATRRAVASDDGQPALPSWLGVAQRYLEACASSSMQESPKTAEDRSAQDGIVNALSFISNVVAEAATSRRQDDSV